jgi:hypothetical protein
VAVAPLRGDAGAGVHCSAAAIIVYFAVALDPVGAVTIGSVRRGASTAAGAISTVSTGLGFDRLSARGLSEKITRPSGPIVL